MLIVHCASCSTCALPKFIITTPKATAKAINREYPEIAISKDAIWRWENLKKNTLPVDQSDILLRYHTLLNDIKYKITKDNDIDNNTKKALKQYIGIQFKGFERFLKNLARETPSKIREEYFDKTCQTIIKLSNLLCPNCKSAVSKLASEELELSHSS